MVAVGETVGVLLGPGVFVWVALGIGLESTPVSMPTANKDSTWAQAFKVKLARKSNKSDFPNAIFISNRNHTAIR
jgi:hypothetical protein